METQIPNAKGRMSGNRLNALWASQSESRQKVLKLLKNFHYASGSQVQRAIFNTGNADAMTRNRNRVLTSLKNDALVLRPPRHGLTGTQAKSTEYIYTLARLGGQLMWREKSTKHVYQPTHDDKEHVGHALEVTEIYARLGERQAIGQIKDLAGYGEPASHREFVTLFGERKIAKPDAYLKFYTWRDKQRYLSEWLVEVELTKQRMEPTIEKIRTYLELEASLQAGEYMPLVIFITYNLAHKKFIDYILDKYTEGSERGLFVSKIVDEAIDVLVS
jgi:hypothetical protein